MLESLGDLGDLGNALGDVVQNRIALGAAAGVGVVVGGWLILRQLRKMDLHGKVTLITGSSRGLGLALAHEFAARGARLIICARHEEALEQTRRELEALGAEVMAVRCDVADQRQVERMVEEATRRFGRIDILVNNAGIIVGGPLLDQTMEDYEQVMAINFWGAVHTARAVMPQMVARRSGRIVNIASVGGKVSVPHLSSYSSAKYALVGYSEGLRAELARDGVSVTTVNPWLMRTGSYVNVYIKGAYQREFAWFALLDSLPLLSMSAKRAARQIVAATQRGQAEVMIGLPAQLAARLNGLLPGVTTNLMGLANRFLPHPTAEGTTRQTGNESESPVTVSFLTALNQRAARHYHQYASPEEERYWKARALGKEESAAPASTHSSDSQHGALR